MIRTHAEGGGAVLEASLDPGAVAYLDAEWLLPATGRALPHVLVAPDGSLRWGEHATPGVGPERDPDLASGLVLLAVAREAINAAREAIDAARPGPGNGSVDVIGSGVVASYIREALPRSADTTTEAPTVIVDTTGDPSAIIEATRRLATLGTLVLAGEAREPGFPMNLYPDLHVRGLHVIGVAPPLFDGRDDGTDALLPETFTRTLSEVSPGAVIADPRGWYRIGPLETV